MRVLITGVGGSLGSRVADLLSRHPGIGAIGGLDVSAPVRPVPALDMTVLDPRDRRLVVKAVRRFAPTAVVHLGIYEPDARATPRVAAERTAGGTIAVLGAAAEGGTLERIVVRSGIEVYGRRRGAPHMPDESVPPDPTTPFGRSLLRVEQLAMATGDEMDVPVTALRFAPLLGPDFPSPLGRLLQRRLVPVSGITDPPFCLLHADDAAHAVVDALFAEVDGPLNVVGSGAVTTFQALRIGGRVPVPVLGPQWAVARRLTTLLGSPVPDHLLELLQRGRTADGGRAWTELGRGPSRSTAETVEALFRWGPVAPVPGLRRTGPPSDAGTAAA